MATDSEVRFDTKGRRTRMMSIEHKPECEKRKYCGCLEVEVDDPDTAELISSDLRGSGLHKPVIDFDIPVRLVPSGTPGHSHLYIDVPCTFQSYIGILGALSQAGLVEPGYTESAAMRGYGSVRHPARPKQKHEGQEGPGGKALRGD